MGNAGTAPVASFCLLSSRSEVLSIFVAIVDALGVLGIDLPLAGRADTLIVDCGLS
jgi:hypothetical protein